MAQRYQKARKKERGRILDEFVALSGYCRTYASWLLRNCGRKIVLSGREGRRVILVGELIKGIKRRKEKVYDEEVLKALKKIWFIMNFSCGKRLSPTLSWLIPKLESHGELKLQEEVREKLFKISASTIDRLLRPERKKLELKSRARTKPGTLLKHQIPIRTFSEWDDKRPGFLEMDLVYHKYAFLHSS
ncbi:MAG: hypothetical protein DDT23_01336 [candidate division WS2 bacterium]|nr:hypothetical protein [Candidatus Lithacetigena glycinireducens]